MIHAGFLVFMTLAGCSAELPSFDAGTGGGGASSGGVTGSGLNGDAGGGPSTGTTDWTATTGVSNTSGDQTNGNSTDDAGAEQCELIKRDAPEAKGGVDVVFVLDTSGSMLHATQQVAANLSNFILDFANTPADTRVVMITGADPATGTAVAGDTSRYLFISSGVDSRQIYSVALDRFPEYQNFLRPNAALQFVMITDDDDNIEAQSFRSQMEGLAGKTFVQHAIASEDVGGAPCTSQSAIDTWGALCTPIPGVGGIPALCTAANIGRRYYALADQTGGLTQSICTADWSGIFAELKGAVIDAVPLPCDYPLSDPSAIDPEEVKVVFSNQSSGEQEFPRASASDQCADRVAWFYDDPDAPTRVSLCPAACELVQGGGSIELGFGCPPEMVPDII